MKLKDFYMEDGERLELHKYYFKVVCKEGHIKYYDLNGNYMGYDDIKHIYAEFYLIKWYQNLYVYNTKTSTYLETSYGIKFKYVGRWEQYMILKINDRYFLYNLYSREFENECDYFFETYKNTLKIFTGEEFIEKFKEKDNNCEKRSPVKTVKIEGFELSIGEQLIYDEGIIIIKTKYNMEYYKTNGTLIGKSDLPNSKNPNFVRTKEIIALCREGKWKIYNASTAQELTDTKFTDLNLDWYDYLIATSENKDPQKSEIMVFNRNGKLLFHLKGYKSIYKQCKNYFVLVDADDQMWVINEKGKKLIDQPLKDAEFRDEFVLEYTGKKMKVYNVGTLQSYCIPAVKKNTIYDSSEYCICNEKKILMVMTDALNKKGVYELTRTGYKEITPIKYEKVSRKSEFLFCTTSKKEIDIYNINGKLLDTIKTE